MSSLGSPGRSLCSVCLKSSNLYSSIISSHIHSNSFSFPSVLSYLTSLLCRSYTITCRKKKTVSVRLLNTYRVALLKLKTATSLVSYIIKKQSLLHWETFGFFLILIYSIFIQTTFDQEHNKQQKLGQL